MEPTRPADPIRKAAETAAAICSKPTREKSARDYSVQFQQRVIVRFEITGSIKQTARDTGVPARIVNEILHLRNLRAPVASATSVGMTRRAAA